MIDHVSIAVRDLDGSGAFYDEVLAAVGLTRLVTRDGTVGYGKKYPEFWLNSRPELAPSQDPGTHICLRAASEDAVSLFYATALQRGATCAGPPGPRDATTTSYFGAFFIDSDGNKLEAATFRPAAAG